MVLPKFLFFSVVLMWSIYGQDYCSLVVKLIDPQGHPKAAEVAVEERDGRIVTKDAETGDSKFCDLGIFPVTVTIGRPECNQVIIRNVPVDWNITTKTTAIYDEKPCQIDSPVAAVCQILLRFRDTKQNSIDDVALQPQAPSHGVYRSDKFGRMMIGLPIGRSIQGNALAKGYLPAPIDIDCTRERMKFEQTLTLKKDTK